MLTKVLSINEQSLIHAKELIDGGDIVAFPTETVFGLGANVFDPCAVEKIFIAKGRPFDNPLIVHIANSEAVETLAEEISPDARKVMEAFMPGPLTVVLKKKAAVHDKVTGGLPTVAVRMPSSKEAQAFLSFVKVPIAAPSANTSTRPSPTCWQHVVEDLDGKIPLVLKGKNCEIGIESTVVDLTKECPLVLRPGIITPSQISSVVGRPVIVAQNNDPTMNSPGLRYKHYAPNCAVWLNTDGDETKISAKVQELSKGRKKVAVFAPSQFCGSFDGSGFFDLGVDDADGAQKIFALLRDGEKQHDAIVIVWNSTTEVGFSVLNRLLKSCDGQTF